MMSERYFKLEKYKNMCHGSHFVLLVQVTGSMYFRIIFLELQNFVYLKDMYIGNWKKSSMNQS